MASTRNELFLVLATVAEIPAVQPHLPFGVLEDVRAALKAPPEQLWAAYAGSAIGSEITLHRSQRAALEAVVQALGLYFPDTEGQDAPDEDDRSEDDRRALSAYDDDELTEEIDTYCSTRADDWRVEEVTLP